MSAFKELLKKMEAMHDAKNADYAKQEDRFSNFTYAAEVSKDFKDPVDRVFAVMLGVKFARLANLVGNREPNNESVLDTRLDISVYAALWTAYWEQQGKLLQSNPVNLPGVYELVEKQSRR